MGCTSFIDVFKIISSSVRMTPPVTSHSWKKTGIMIIQFSIMSSRKRCTSSKGSLNVILFAFLLFLTITPSSMASTSWHAYDEDLVKSKGLLKECQVYENSTNPHRYHNSYGKKGLKNKASNPMSLWPGKSCIVQLNFYANFFVSIQCYRFRSMR